MNRRIDRFRVLVLGAAAAMALSSGALAQEDASSGAPQTTGSAAIDPEGFRAALLKFVEITEARTRPAGNLYAEIAALDAEALQVLYDAWPDPSGFAEVVDRMAARSGASVYGGPLADPGAAGPDGGFQPQSIIGVPPPCEPFEPDYPSSGLLDFLTSLGLADVQPNERCSDDDVEIFATAKIAAEVAAIAAQAACDHITVILGEGTNAPFCVAAGIANGVKAAAQVVLDACQELTNQVDSAEIEGAYENTKIIIDALCCVPPAQSRKGHGCDGQDSDCDESIDECDEDTFGPDVFVDPAIRGQCFQDATDAISALQQAVETSDDCGKVTIEANLSGATCDVEGSVKVADDCGNETSLGGVGIRIDGEAPQVSCSVTTSVLSPPNLAYTDVGFSYTAVDNCSGDLKVEIKVTSDEQTTLPPGVGKASPFPDASVLRTIDGTIVGVQLRNERGGGGDGRVYTIHVYATDQCGNVGYSSCSVSVPPADSVPAVDSGQYFDATGIN
ncbi:MAG: acid shock protein [Phycisphaerae bacterium]|nr:acid shock protein [Phycisphaerae bacterium]